MNKQKNLPALRFPKFEGGWKEESLLNLSENGFSNGIFNDPAKVGKGYKLINVKDMYVGDEIDVNNLTLVEIDEKEFRNNKVEYGDIFFTRSSLVKEGIAYSNINLSDSKDLTYDGHLIRMRPNKSISLPLFLLYNFSTTGVRRQLIKRGKTTTMTTIGQEDIATVVITLPSIKEQNKIATFLKTVEVKLTQLKKKKTHLEQYKKGVMQKIFSQEIRFKDENGKEFPKWENKKLGCIFYSEKGNGLSKSKISENGKHECILYGELYTKYNEVVFSIVSKTNDTESLMSKKGDLLIPSSTTTTGIDLANVTALNKEGVLLGGDITVLRSKEEISNTFYAYYLSNHRKQEIANLAQGITIVHLYYSHIKEMIIDYPCYTEQTKIANFLSAIDEKIYRVNEQIDKTELWKKGLLQKCFAKHD